MSEKESKPVVVKGVITCAYHGVTKFDKKEERLHLSIKFDDGERAKLAAICSESGIFSKTDSGFIPAWFKDEKAEYINFKSNFDIPAQYIEGGRKIRSSIEDMLADMGSITGSHCAAALTLKDGAIYVKAIAIDVLKVQDFGEMFGEDNPFADMEELPFN